MGNWVVGLVLVQAVESRTPSTLKVSGICPVPPASTSVVAVPSVLVCVMSMVVWSTLLPYTALFRSIGTPTMLPVALAEAEVKLPWERWVKPGKLNTLMPLGSGVRRAVERHFTDICPVGPTKVLKFGLPVVLVLKLRQLPPPLRSRFRLRPHPPRVV